MKILLVSTQDYIHHPVPSRHHYIFEELATRHEVHVAHFHVSRGNARPTRLIVEEATQFPLKNPLLHYSLNTPYHFHIFNRIIRENKFDVVVAAHVLAGSAVIHAAKRYKVPVIFDLKDWFPDSAAAYFKNRFLKDLRQKKRLGDHQEEFIPERLYHDRFSVSCRKTQHTWVQCGVDHKRC